jgi:NADPH:quinone reductase-like Zn-dependent oxidoreductase
VPALQEGGIFIRVPSASDLDEVKELAGGRARVTGILVEPDRYGLEALAGLAEAGELRVHVERTFPLEDAARAHELGEAGRTQGKLVLTVG